MKTAVWIISIIVMLVFVNLALRFYLNANGNIFPAPQNAASEKSNNSTVTYTPGKSEPIPGYDGPALSAIPQKRIPEVTTCRFCESVGKPLADDTFIHPKDMEKKLFLYFEYMDAVPNHTTAIVKVIDPVNQTMRIKRLLPKPQGGMYIPFTIPGHAVFGTYKASVGLDNEFAGSTVFVKIMNEGDRLYYANPAPPGDGNLNANNEPSHRMNIDGAVQVDYNSSDGADSSKDGIASYRVLSDVINKALHR